MILQIWSGFNSKYVVICGMSAYRRNEILHKQIVDKLIRIRKERNLTQDNVRNDMNELNIGRIEAGLHMISITTLSDLCDYYGVTLEEFFRGISSKP